MMSMEISDQFENFICGVWVEKRTVAIIRDLQNIPKRHSALENVLMFLQQHLVLIAHEWYLKERFTSITTPTCVKFSCLIYAKIVEAYILEYRNCALFMSFPQTMETVLD